MQPHQRTPLNGCVAVVFGLLALVSLGRSLAAQENVFTAQRVAELQTVTAAVVSPDGQSTAFVRSVPRQPAKDDDGPAWTELWMLREGETEPRPFVVGQVNVSAVRWTPDSRAVGFLAKRGEDKFKSIYLLAVDGGEARVAVSHTADITDYSFAPDGQRVAFLASEPEAEDVTKQREQGFKQQVYEEDQPVQRVWTARVFAPDEKPHALPLEGHAHTVRWSPRDDRLLVAVAPTPTVDDSLMRQRLRIIDPGSGEVRARIENPGKLGVFEWSPDARHVAFVAAEDINDPNAGRLMLGDAATGEFRPLIALDWQGDAGDIAWVDSETLLFIGQQGPETLIARARIGQTAAQPEVVLAPGAGAITSLSGARDGGRFALIAHTANHPAELFSWSPGAEPERRTRSNPWLADVRLAPQEVMSFKARDGLALEGILIRPLDAEQGRRYPLILTVHGGPEAHVMNGWVTGYSTPGQLAAARGFAVFYPNYRGSTGRGVAFSKLGQGDPAGREFDDLVDAVDHLVRIGLVDTNKVGVTGGSYGGYATAWCSTRYSERFAAGVMFVGISNKISKVGTTDIPDEEFHVHARHRPWDNWQFLLERSPIYYAGQSQTPLLILHGADDPRVNVGQSRELYRHLKLRSDAPVRLVLYPGEGHGNSRAAARLDYTLRLMQWMEHYLKGEGGTPPDYRIDYGLKTEEDDDADADSAKD